MQIIDIRANIISENLHIILIMKNCQIYYFAGEVKNNRGQKDYCITLPVTDSRGIAGKILNVLHTNLVYPSHFEYVIDDIWDKIN